VKKLIVYSVAGTWWDSIDKAGLTPSGLPCCPLCGSMLFEIEEKDWMDGIDRMEKEVPGYRKFWEWLRGKCFKNLSDALVEYSKIEPNFNMTGWAFLGETDL
jgi:hypothetical protein